MLLYYVIYCIIVLWCNVIDLAFSSMINSNHYMEENLQELKAEVPKQ